MQQSKVLETWVGLFVLLGMVSLFFLAMKVSNLADLQVKDDSYRLFARFQNVGSLRERAPVSMAGVRIGRVSSISFDNKTYEALVEMKIQPQYKAIPTDTTANILTAGLLGEQYIGLSAGGEEEYFKDGDEIELSQSAMVLEEVISRFLFDKAEKGSQKRDSTSLDSSEEKVDSESRLIQEAPAKQKPQATAHDKTAINKPVSALLPRSEKGEPEPVRKHKTPLVKPAEDAHAGHKSKDSEGRDADHKHKQAVR